MHPEQKFDILDAEYVLVLNRCDAEAIVGHFDHVNSGRESGFGSVTVPVGYLLAHITEGIPEISRKHWSIQIFFRSDVRYDQASETTTVVASPERQAGQKRALFSRAVPLGDGSLPLYHPELPKALGRTLLDAQLCREPMSVQVDHTTPGPLIHFGNIYDED